jgi:hypothetical protein
LLHIVYEVVSQLDNASDFWQWTLEELSLRDFRVEQIYSLQLVVEAQVNLAPPLVKDTIALVQAPWPSPPDAGSLGRLLGALVRVDGQVIADCYGPFSCTSEVMLSPLQQGPKPSWDALPLPPQPDTPPDCYYDGLHPNTQREVRSMADGVVIGCNLFSTGNLQVATGNSLCAVHHMK